MWPNPLLVISLAKMLASEMTNIPTSDQTNLFNRKIGKSKNMILLASYQVKLAGEDVGIVPRIPDLV